jgi:pre-mRNA-splicing factor CWC26
MNSNAGKTGLHSSEEFGKLMKRKREEESTNLDHKSKRETTYFDSSGKKIDMLTHYMKEKAIEESNKYAVEEAQRDLRKGAVQKKEREERIKDYLEIKNEPFARHIDDPKLERIRKEALRDGDPMAAYFEKKELVQEKEGRSSNSKPKYKGPNPTPNRFGIRPGYRWDAIDRGNGFEKKLLLKINEKQSFNEEEYKWRVSDL